MGSKSSTTTQNSTQAYTPAGRDQLNDVWGRIQNVASLPYNPYGGQTVADLSPTQRSGISNVNAAFGTQQPYFDAAVDYMHRSGAPISPDQIARHMNPFTSSVIDATRANFAETNAQQNQQLLGNAIMKGALGGDRVGVAQAEMARQQRLAQDPVIANLNAQGFAHALAAAQADRAAAGGAGAGFASMAPSALSTSLQGATAQLGAGGLERDVAQQFLTDPYQRHLMREAFPYQQAQFLTSAGIPALSAMGGTQTGTERTTTPGPSLISQIAGLGLAAAGAASGNPMAAMGGLSSLFGGGGGGAAAANTGAPGGGYFGPRGQVYAGPGFYPGMRNGGRVVPGYADGGFIESINAMRGALKRYASGGEVIDMEEDASGIFVPAPLSPQQRIDDTFTGVSDAIASGNFDPVGDNFPVSRPAGAALPFAPMASGPAPTGMPAGIPMPAPAPAAQFPMLPPPSPVAPAAPEPQSSPFGGFLSGISDDARLGMMAAGLGMMASKSPFPLVAIGEGGLQGVKTYQQAKRDKKETKDTAEIQAKRLAQQAEQFSKRLELDNRKLEVDETTRRDAIEQRREAAERAKVQIIPQTRDIDGKQVPGTLYIDTTKRPDDPEAQRWVPGQVTTPKSGAAGRPPAEVATAEWLVKNGVAPDQQAAWDMVRQGRANPATLRTQIYNNALRSTHGNAKKAEQITRDAMKFLDVPAGPGAPTAKPGPKASEPLPAPTDPTKRKEGETYRAPNGRLGIWRGTGWEPVQ